MFGTWSKLYRRQAGRQKYSPPPPLPSPGVCLNGKSNQCSFYSYPKSLFSLTFLAVQFKGSNSCYGTNAKLYERCNYREMNCWVLAKYCGIHKKSCGGKGFYGSVSPSEPHTNSISQLSTGEPQDLPLFYASCVVQLGPCLVGQMYV